ncbi:Na(+)-translocating NADH-quinone reductase subunit F [Winogradskyella sp. UBA3174]|uniref:Na(+)-translocating NADH-quinone reductase subunit F n=1 Tax=Winogradskyella sp. UBA3174 TaxID=1947785 RepID=UPI0025CD1D30|nr:Na(+)-translocating NADH-quinone reductase subunit F [Winogradskyella sp. UBA3174]|tara:strand:- start:9579 stop:10019 length:441 start_codon:yes stop_codon:yes gene_type:complete
MITSIRFDSAINKLYNAFHNNTLNPEDCKQCAVGNILDNKDSWQHLTDFHGTKKLNYLGLIHQNLDRKFNGYTPLELLQIEAAFLKGCDYKLTPSRRLHRPKHFNDTILFNGLCKVVSQLCTLDNIENVMDCSALFKFEEQLEPQS